MILVEITITTMQKEREREREIFICNNNKEELLSEKQENFAKLS